MAEQAAKPSSQKEPIKASELDPKWKYELQKLHGAEGLMRCFQCGTCTSDCPVARFTDNYRPRTLIHMAQLGLKVRVLKSDTLWLCSACFTCTDRCPGRRSRKRHPSLPQPSSRIRLCPTGFPRPSTELNRNRLRIQNPRTTTKET